MRDIYLPGERMLEGNVPSREGRCIEEDNGRRNNRKNPDEEPQLLPPPTAGRESSFQWKQGGTKR